MKFLQIIFSKIIIFCLVIGITVSNLNAADIYDEKEGVILIIDNLNRYPIDQ